MSALRDLLFSELSLALVRARMGMAVQRAAAWWLTEFRALWPDAVVGRLCGHGAPVVRLSTDRDAVLVDVAPRRGRAAHNAAIARSGYSAGALDRHLADVGVDRAAAVVGLVLPPTAMFSRSFDIPARARPRLSAIARQELEHRTPFAADAVHLGMKVVPKPHDPHRLTVHQSIVRRDLVEAAVQELDLAPADIAFVAAQVDHDDPFAVSISLQPDSDSTASPVRRVAVALATAAVLIAGADGMLLWGTRQSAIFATEERAAIERDKALTVRGLADEIARIQSSLRALDERRRLPTTADLWRETSRVLPDTTWVTDWRRRDGTISIAGYSTAATELVALFERSPLFGEATLDAPITTDAATGRERFSLVLRIRARGPQHGGT